MSINTTLQKTFAITLSPPLIVRTSHYFWIGAILTAVAELLVRLVVAPGGFAAAIAEGLPELAVRIVAYAVLLTLSMLMLSGRSWARWALLVIFGGLGTFSLVFEPLQWIAEGGSGAGFLAAADLPTWLMIVTRILHVACVWIGIVLMFMPESNAFFRARTTRALGS